MQRVAARPPRGPRFGRGIARRRALQRLAALPFAARAQTRLTPGHHVVLGGVIGMLIGPDGSVQTWMANPAHAAGYDAEDVLGLGHNGPVDPFTLYRVPGLTGVTTAVAASSAAYAVADGRVLSWGSGGYGLLGTTPLAELETRAQPRMRANSPQPVAVPFDAVDVSAKGDHVLALSRDGGVYAWGRGDAGQLGIGPLPVINYRTRTPTTENYVPFPVRLPSLRDVVAISAGSRHSLALLEDGTVWGWGENRWGQVGDGTTVSRPVPTPVAGIRGAIAVAATGYSSMAILADGTAMDWGSTYVNNAPRPTPAVVPGARGLHSAVGGDMHVVALTRTGGVMTWGNDAHYQTGRGRTAGGAAGLIKELTGVQSIAASGRGSAAVLRSGRIMIWSEVRPYPTPSGRSNLSPAPMPLSLAGLEQP